MNEAGKSWQIREALLWSERRLAEAGIECPRREASLLLRAACGVSKETYYQFRPSHRLDEPTTRRFRCWTAKRAERVPLAYLTGECEFYGRLFDVSPDVLIPRPETEHLVEEVLQWVQTRQTSHERLQVADLGTGSGVIAVTLAAEQQNLRLIATDLSDASLRVARNNARRHGVENRIQFVQGDWYEALRQFIDPGTLDVIVSNPPYIDADRRGSLQPELRYEPERALFAGQEGYADLFQLVDGAGRFLHDRGAIFLEIGADQYERVSDRLRRRGFAVRGVRDFAGHWRVVIGEKSV